MTTACAIRDCPGEFYLRGYCRPHYECMLQYGDPIFEPRRKPPVERFLAKVEQNGPKGCWIWNGNLSGGRDGCSYGFFWSGEHMLLSHRFAYQTWVGPIPETYQVHHKCHNTRCVNPEHLVAVTPEVNQEYEYTDQTTCNKGHPYNLLNTRLYRGKYRECRVCARERATRYRAVRKTLAN